MIVGVEGLLRYPETKPELPDAVHVKRVPATGEVRVIPVEMLLQMLLLNGLFDKVGVG